MGAISRSRGEGIFGIEIRRSELGAELGAEEDAEEGAEGVEIEVIIWRT